MTELGSITEGRSGLGRHSRTLGFSLIELAVRGVGSGPSQKVGRFSSPLHEWNGHGHSLVPNMGERGLEEERCASMGGASTTVLWFPTRGEAWPGGGALRCYRREKRRRRTEERREEEKRRKILIGADQDQDLFFLLRLSRVFKQEVLSLVFSRWRC